ESDAQAGLGEAPGAVCPPGAASDDGDPLHPRSGSPRAPSPEIHSTTPSPRLPLPGSYRNTGRRGSRYSLAPMRYAAGKTLEVAGMLTLGVALFVYGFGESDMTAELGWLLAGSVVFLIGYLLERRREGGS